LQPIHFHEAEVAPVAFRSPADYFGVTTALILAFSPEEKEPAARASLFSVVHPINPAAIISQDAARVSPSPWRRGPG
jgi:hypothetical protein